MAGISVDRAKAMMRDDLKGMKAEYTRMRDIAQKRVARLKNSEFEWTKAFQNHAEGFKKLKDIDMENFAYEFSELSKFVGAKSSKVTGQRSRMNKTINTWNKQGIPLSKETYRRTIEILEEMRKRKITYDSETAYDLAKMSLELSDDQMDDVLDDLDKFLTHTDEFAQYLEEKRDKETGYLIVDDVSIDEFKSMIGG